MIAKNKSDDVPANPLPLSTEIVPNTPRNLRTMDSDEGILEGAAELQQHVNAESDDEDELSRPIRVSASAAENHNIDAEENKTSEHDLDENYTIEVQVPAAVRPWEYKSFPEDTTVRRVIKELLGHGDELAYKIAYQDGRTEEVSI